MSTREQRNKDLIEAWTTALHDRDRTALAALVAEEGVRHIPEGDREGREAYIESEFGIFETFPDLSFEITHVIAEDDMIAVRYRATGTHDGDHTDFAPTGNEVEFTAIEIFRIENGLIVENWGEMDNLDAMEQVGVLNDWQIRNQYQSVLTRVLRHNLRNDLGTILAYADAIVDLDAAVAGDLNADAAAHAESIRSVATRLVTLAEKVRELERIAVDKPIRPGEIDLTGRVSGLLGEWRRAHPAASITSTAPDEGVWVRTDAVLVEHVLTELVENAVAHNDTEEPAVEIEVSARTDDGDPVVLRVSDDGPGIPAHELDPIEAGSEDPLMHGSSVGLWAVKWGVDRLEGDLEFGENHPRGSTVELRVPDLDDGG